MTTFMILYFKKFYPWLLFIFLGTFAWGTSFFWVKIALKEITTFEVVAWRVSFGAIFFWSIILSKRSKISLNRDIFKTSLVLAVFLLILPACLATWAENYITSNLTSVLYTLTPLFTITCAFLIPNHKQEVSEQIIFGIFVAFLGILLIFIKDLSAYSFDNTILPQLAVIAASLSYALGTLYAKSKVANSNTLIISLYSLTCGALILWCIVLIIDSRLTLPSQPSTWLALIWLGVVCSGAANLIYFTLVLLLGPVNAASIAYLNSLTAYLLGVFILEEKLTLLEICGGLGILIGIYIANYKKSSVLPIPQLKNPI
jgi:drug/metabolite transporter (DMT)-like permease